MGVNILVLPEKWLYFFFIPKLKEEQVSSLKEAWKPRGPTPKGTCLGRPTVLLCQGLEAFGEGGQESLFLKPGQVGHL